MAGLVVSVRVCRGVIATATLTEEDQVERPVIVVPDSLSITADTAVSTIDRLLTQYRLPSIRRLPHELQVALYLAHEANLGEPWARACLGCVRSCNLRAHCAGLRSRFAPYLATMPEVPPCGWMMAPEAAAAALQGIVAECDMPRWLHMLQEAREIYVEVRSRLPGCLGVLSC